MKTASQQQMELLVLFDRSQAEMLQLILGELQQEASTLRHRVKDLEDQMNRVFRHRKTAAKTPNEETRIGRELSKAWQEGGPLAFGAKANSAKMREFSRPWRRIISMLRNDPDTALMVLDGLGVTITEGDNHSRLYCRPASAISFEELIEIDAAPRSFDEEFIDEK